ncbi:MAG TPA: acyl-CoA synthetase [Polyangiales bacterium]
MEALEVSLVERARAHPDACAIVDADGQHTYADLLEASARIASGLLDGARDLDGARVCFLIAPSFRYVATQWAIVRAGGVAVPLCVSHPEPELAHVIDDSAASIVVADPEFDPKLRPLTAAAGLRHVEPNALLQAKARPLQPMAAERDALLIYTSGTTGKPKGAVTTHAVLDAQMRSIVQAWEMTARDRLLHVLPLHHLHGILNALCAPLYAGACVELAPRFEPMRVLERFAAAPTLTLFMAVPTIYAKLVAEWPRLPSVREQAVRSGLARLRLMVSGSAALPVSLLAQVQELSGHFLLERYGMTEIGMALGNPLHGERRAGSVGVPFPGVEARIVDERGNAVGEDVAGELQIRGPNVFARYFRKSEATQSAFTEDGFFRTGDVAIRERGYYRLLGRESVDIIKTGGFKVSALEIEESLREHPAIAEVAIVGVADPEWGERVAAAVVLQPAAALTLDELRSFGKARLANYKVPSLLRVFDALPRNALGKVQKPPLKALFAADGGNG